MNRPEPTNDVGSWRCSGRQFEIITRVHQRTGIAESGPRPRGPPQTNRVRSDFSQQNRIATAVGDLIKRDFAVKEQDPIVVRIDRRFGAIVTAPVVGHRGRQRDIHRAIKAGAQIIIDGRLPHLGILWMIGSQLDIKVVVDRGLFDVDQHLDEE